MQEADTALVVPLGEPPFAAEIRVMDAGTWLAERFEIRRALGVGGFAVVYLAFDRELKREVALKVLRSDRMAAGAVERLRREASVARDAASPRLVRVFDIGVSATSVHLTMEVVHGESLRERLKRGALPVAEAVRLAEQVLEGLAVLHALGIVHRDVKPGNILLDEAGDVKLADFGLARYHDRAETRLTVSEAVLGTLDYLSPEQALAQTVDPRSDLYSLGVVLFEALTGGLPHPARSSLGAVLGRLQQRAPDVRRSRPDVPAWLSSIVAGLLERDPARRYPSAAAVQGDFARRRRVRRTELRRRVLLGVAAVAALLVIGAAIGGWLVARRPRYARLVRQPGALGGLMAVDLEGKPLWWKEGVFYGDNFVEIHVRGTAHRYLAAVLEPAGRFDPKSVGKLSILDAETGKSVKDLAMPSVGTQFRDFSNLYAPALAALDLDEDGTDEVLVTYVHLNLWPSFTVLCEPWRDRSRVVFVASGHHHLAGAEDVDGDGHRDLIFSGINNRMGWFSAIAAVNVAPWLQENGIRSVIGGPAGSPDDYYLADRGKLLWYALGPSGAPDVRARADVHRERRSIGVSYQDLPKVEIGFDGFLRRPASTLPVRERQAQRNEAYAHLREATRLLRLGDPEDAMPEDSAARRAAQLATDPNLMQWIDRVHGMALIASGRYDEAEALFRSVLAGTEGNREAAYDAGRAYHLAGRLEESVAWYRRGFGTGAGAASGRGRYEFLEGIVLALGELGRWDEAIGEVERYHRVYTAIGSGWVYREYARWRRNEVPALTGLNFQPGDSDLQRYWYLEFRHARTDDPRVLLRAVDDEISCTTEAKAFLHSLRGELLDRLGRRAEALAVERTAVEETRALLRTAPAARAHYDLVAGRFAALARRAGREDDARAALAELSAWRRRGARG